MNTFTQIIAQLVDAVGLCQSVGIAHRDIKLSNITYPFPKLLHHHNQLSSTGDGLGHMGGPGLAQSLGQQYYTHHTSYSQGSGGRSGVPSPDIDNAYMGFGQPRSMTGHHSFNHNQSFSSQKSLKSPLFSGSAASPNPTNLSTGSGSRLSTPTPPLFQPTIQYNPNPHTNKHRHDNFTPTLTGDDNNININTSSNNIINRNNSNSVDSWHHQSIGGSGGSPDFSATGRIMTDFSMQPPLNIKLSDFGMAGFISKLC